MAIKISGSTIIDDSRNIVNAGVVTASSFDGNITGIAAYTSEWNITSNGSSDYRFTGPGFDGTENDPTIYLVRGQEYKFTNNMGAHPFQIRTAINGSAYNDGITNNGVSNGTLTWDVQMDAPNILYYQCTSHAGMVGKIYIGNSGSSIDIEGNSTFDGDVTFTGALYNALWDKSGDKLKFADNAKTTFGTDDDLEIFHDSVNSHISNSTGTLFINQYLDDGDIALRTDDGSGGFANYIICDGSEGSVNLYHYGSKKFETGQFGVTVTGSLAASNIDMVDDAKLLLGTGDDLQIYHDGNNSYVEDTGVGALIMKGSTIRFRSTTNESIINASQNGAVELYYDDSKKFETTGIGISVVNGTSDTATIAAPANLILDPAVVGDNTGVVRIKGDLFVDGTTTQINSTSLEIADFVVGIASTATTDLLTDGAGIKIGPDNTFLYEHNGGTNPSLKSSENLNVATGKAYQIAETERLSADTLSVGTGATVHSPASNTLTLGTNGTEKLRITSDGSVAIGTVTASTKLEVAGTGSPTIRIRDLDGSEKFGQIIANAGVFIIESRNNNVDGKIIFRGRDNTDTNEYARFDENGNFGIGTNSPDTLLHLQSSNPTLRLTDSNQATDNKSWNINAGQTQLLRIQAINDAGSGGGKLFDFYRTDTQVEKFLGRSGTEYWFVVDNTSRRVGIGTDVPAVPLDIRNANPTLRLYDTDGTNAYTNITNINGNMYLGARNNSSNGTLLFGGYGGGTFTEFFRASSNGFIVRTNGEERLRVASTGNVGIGTDVPAAKLDVRGTLGISNTTDTSVRTTITSSSTGLIVNHNDNSDTIFQNQGAEKVRITDSGLVGIGTNDPQAFLRIETPAATAGWQVRTDSYGLNNESGFYRDENDDYECVIRNGDGGLAFIKNNGGASNPNLHFHVGTSEKVRITSGGDVGIGTATPRNSAKLDVHNPTASGVYINYDGKSNTEYGLRIESNAAGGNFESDFVNGTTALLDLYANSSTVTGGDLLVARTQSSTPVLLVKGNGNIGINTTNPSTLLHAHSGAIRVTNAAKTNVVELTTDGNVEIKRTGGGAFIDFADATNQDHDARIQHNSGLDFTTGIHGDSSNPPQTRLTIDNDGRLLLRSGTTGSTDRVGGFHNALQVEGTGAASASIAIIRNSDDENSPYLNFGKSRGTSLGSNTVVGNDDTLAIIDFTGSDGSGNFNSHASIRAFVDGAPGNGDSPGKITFWTTPDGTTTPGERLTIKNNGRIGIGSDDPAARLDVYKNFGGISAGTYAGRVYGTDSGVSETGVRFVTKGTGDLHNVSDAYLMHGISNGTTRFVFGANGNVGIGLTNPTALLHVQNDSVSDTKIIIESTGTNSYPALRIKNDARSYDLGIDGATDALRVYDVTGAAERLRITSTGVFQLSNLSSAYTSGTATRFSLYNDTDNHYGLHVGGSFDLNYNAGGSVIGGKGEHVFHTAAAERLRITSAGNVGIGTDNPTGKLQVGSATGSHVIITENTGIDINDGAINLYQATSNVNAAPFIISTDVGGTETEKLRVTGAGKVGIGSAAPTSPLDIAVTSGAGDPRIRFDEVNDDPFIELNRWTGTGTNYYGIRSRSRGGDLIFEFADSSTTIGNHSYTEKLRIKSDGKVGIGTADPNSVLDIVAADPVLTLRDTSASVTNANATLRLAESNGNGVIDNYWDVVADNTVSNFGFAIKQNLSGTITTRFAIHAGTGNIGIGTDNPQRKLVVSDNGTEGLEFFPGDSVNGSTINVYNRATTAFTPFSLNAQDYRLSPNGGAEAVRITSDGNIGIGTNNPGTKFDVNGAIKLRGNNETTYAAVLKANYDSTHVLSLEAYHNSNSAFEVIGTHADGGGGNVRVAIAKDGQKVGIATDNPAAKLDVYGDAKIGGTASADRVANFDTNGRLSLSYGDNSNNSILTLKNTNTAATTNHGANILWQFGTSVSSSSIDAAKISAIKQNQWTTDTATHDSTLIFELRNNGSLGERVRISPSGSIGLKGELDFSGPADKYIDFVTDDGGGNIYAASLRMINEAQTSFKTAIKMYRNSGVDLYFNDDVRFYTHLGGVHMRGRDDGYWTGIDVQHRYSSASQEAGSYLDFKNENNKAKSSVHSILLTDGTSRLRFGVTGSGVARDADSRTQIFELSPTGATVTGIVTATSYSDTTYTLSGTDIDPANGGIQTKVAGANTTFTESLSAGDSVVLHLEGGSSYTITWPTITWVTSSGNSAPTLTAKDVVVLWKISTTLYGAYAGSYA